MEDSMSIIIHHHHGGIHFSQRQGQEVEGEGKENNIGLTFEWGTLKCINVLQIIRKRRDHWGVN